MREENQATDLCVCMFRRSCESKSNILQSRERELLSSIWYGHSNWKLELYCLSDLDWNLRPYPAGQGEKWSTHFLPKEVPWFDPFARLWGTAATLSTSSHHECSPLYMHGGPSPGVKNLTISLSSLFSVSAPDPFNQTTPGSPSVASRTWAPAQW